MKIRVLIIEDSEANATSVVRELEKVGYETFFERVETAESLRDSLSQQEWDIVISDYNMPGFSGSQALEILKATGKDVPFLFFSGSIAEDEALKILKAGASDIIMKGHTSRLVLTVVRELREVQERREKRRMEQALIESEEKYRELVDEVNDGFYISDSEGVLLFANKALAKMLGYEHPEKLIGKKFLEFITPETVEEVDKRFGGLVKGETHYEISVSKIIGADGKERYLEVKPSLILKEDKVVGARGVIRDITERQLLEQQLRQSQKMEAVGRLAGGISHDFNNLLTVMIGYCQMVEKKIPEDNPLHKDVQEIKKSAIRAASLTKQLLAFSRKQILQPEKMNLNNIVAEMDVMLRRVIGEDIELLSVTCPELGLVMADPGQIEQVIMNLVVNARDAMPDGGKLTLETANVHLSENFVRLNPGAKAGHYAMIAITDTGCGMDANTLSKLFEPFFTTKAPGKGTGLGLSTVYGIIKQSDGYISVYSEVGTGTTFKVYLPLVSGSVVDQKTGSGTGKVPLYKPTETILLAEDEEAVRNLAQRILSEQGYKVLAASDALQALQILQEHKGKIDLLITDMIMPGMTGLGLVQRVQANYPQIKVMYISGYTDTAILHQGLLEPSTAFLQKPFTPHTLLKKIREVLTGANIISTK